MIEGQINLDEPNPKDKTPEEIYSQIQETNWSNYLVSFYVCNRKFNNKIPYSIYQINCDTETDNLFTQFINYFFGNSTYLQSERNIIEYNYANYGESSTLLATKTTNFKYHLIINDIIENSDIDTAKKYNTLINGNFYILRFSPSNGEPPLYAFRRIQTKYNYNPKSKNTLSNILFGDGKLIGVEKRDSFKLDQYFDYISYVDHIFIQDKKNVTVQVPFKQSFNIDHLFGLWF